LFELCVVRSDGMRKVQHCLHDSSLESIGLRLSLQILDERSRLPTYQRKDCDGTPDYFERNCWPCLMMKYI
jgi:hypothetical protein